MKSVFIALLFFLSLHCPAQQNTWQWGVSFGGGFNYLDRLDDLLVDTAGNSYAIGVAGAAFIFNDSIYDGYQKGDIYIISFDCEGNLRWLTFAGTDKYDKIIPDMILLLENDQLIILASLSYGNLRTFYFQDTSITDVQDRVMIARLNSQNGELVKFRLLGPKTTSSAIHASIYNNDFHYYIISSSEGEVFPGVSFEKGTHIVTCDRNDNYIRHFTASPNRLYEIVNSGLRADDMGNYYIAGNRKLSDTIGGQTGRSGAFLAKFSPSGQLRWITGEEKGPILLNAMDISKNTICITGYANKGAVLSGQKISFRGSSSSRNFIAGYGFDGSLQWITPGDSSDNSSVGNAIVFNNNTWVNTGWYTGTLKIGNTILNSLGTQDAYVIWYNENGNPLNTISIAGTGGNVDEGIRLARDPNGNIYVGGTFASELYIAGDTLRQQWSDRDVFIAKYGVPRCRDSATAVLYYPMPSEPVSVFPNPAKQYITVRLTHAFRQNLYFTLYDIQGRKVRSRIISAGSSGFIFDRAALSGGLYLWQLRSTDGPVAAGKLMLE